MSQFEDYPRRGEREYDHEVAEERWRRAGWQCQCWHMDMPGTCMGPWQCPLVEQKDEDD